MSPKFLSIILLTLLLVAGSVFAFASTGQPNMQRAGGQTTIFNRSFRAFELPAEGLSESELARHTETDPLFERSHIPLDDHQGAGLGPLHNAKSCASCHVLNGRGRPIEGQSLFRIALRENGGTRPVPELGFQLQDRATFGNQPEAIVLRNWVKTGKLRRLVTEMKTSDGIDLAEAKVSRSLRIPPPLIGLGLIELIPDEDILARSDPEDLDGDGISGKPVWNRDEKGEIRLGRFGWKAIATSLRQQSIDAYNEDMGITTPLGPKTNLSKRGLPADISWEELEGVTFYSQTLGAPATVKGPNSQIVQSGFRIFNDLHCASCHVPRQETGISSHAVAQVINNQTIWPYTDLLVHDMGPGLDDGVAEHGLSESSEWRTAPLWGIGLTKRVNHKASFLHDGRARSIEEAILWHGGEANSSKEQFEALTTNERAQLLDWLNQL